MKSGDIVVCIDNSGFDDETKSDNLIYGQNYVIQDYNSNDHTLDIIPINGNTRPGYRAFRFISLEDWREKQLDKILL